MVRSGKAFSRQHEHLDRQPPRAHTFSMGPRMQQPTIQQFASHHSVVFMPMGVSGVLNHFSPARITHLANLKSLDMCADSVVRGKSPTRLFEAKIERRECDGGSWSVDSASHPDGRRFSSTKTHETTEALSLTMMQGTLVQETKTGLRRSDVSDQEEPNRVEIVDHEGSMC